MAERGRRVQLAGMGMGMGQHETAEHEEEQEKGKAVAHDLAGAGAAQQGQMDECDSQGGQAAQAVQYDEAMGGGHAVILEVRHGSVRPDCGAERCGERPAIHWRATNTSKIAVVGKSANGSWFLSGTAPGPRPRSGWRNAR